MSEAIRDGLKQSTDVVLSSSEAPAELHLSETEITTLVVKHKEGAPPAQCSLQKLMVAGCMKLSELVLHDQTMLRELDLSGCTALKLLHLSGCTALGSLRDIAQLQQLTSLHASGCYFETVDDVAKLEALSTLDLGDCPNLTQLDLRGCASLTDLNLARCSKLSSLQLEGCLELQHMDTTSCASLDLGGADKLLVGTSVEFASTSGASPPEWYSGERGLVVGPSTTGNTDRLLVKFPYAGLRDCLRADWKEATPTDFLRRLEGYLEKEEPDTLPVSEKVDALISCLQLAEEGLMATQGQPQSALVVFGDTGVGKSTLMNFLCGCSMKKVPKKGIYVAEDSLVPELFEISRSKQKSQTMIPSGVHFKSKFSAFGVDTIVDFPGLSDSRGEVIETANMINMKLYLEKLQKVRFMIMLRPAGEDGFAEKGKTLKRAFKLMESLLGSKKDLREHANSIMVAIRPPDPDYDEEDAKTHIDEYLGEWFEKDSESRRNLLSSTYVYRLEGPEERAQIWARVHLLTPVCLGEPARKYFPSSSFDRYVTELKAMVEQLVNELTANLETNMVKAAQLLADLDRLRCVDIDVVSTLVDQRTAQAFGNWRRVVQEAADEVQSCKETKNYSRLSLTRAKLEQLKAPMSRLERTAGGRSGVGSQPWRQLKAEYDLAVKFYDGIEVLLKDLQAREAKVHDLTAEVSQLKQAVSRAETAAKYNEGRVRTLEETVKGALDYLHQFRLYAAPTFEPVAPSEQDALQWDYCCTLLSTVSYSKHGREVESVSRCSHLL